MSSSTRRRRCWRFGQECEVDVHVVTTDVESAVLANVKRKQADADTMAVRMVEHMKATMMDELQGTISMRDEYKTETSHGDGWTMHLGDCVEMLRHRALAREPVHVHFVNAYVIALAEEDADYRDLLRAGLCLTDGTPVAWLGRWVYGQSRKDWQRVYGPDVMACLLASPGLRHYLLGGTEQTLAALQTAIARRWSQALDVGASSPPKRWVSAGRR